MLNVIAIAIRGVGSFNVRALVAESGIERVRRSYLTANDSEKKEEDTPEGDFRSDSIHNS
jgi:hypothetical protein